MKRRQPDRHGFLNVDKPAGMTSRDVIDRVCRIVGSKRVGHAGTLDPLATGVLVVAVGKATRLVEYVHAQRKTYRAGFLLGQTSDTDDVEGTIAVRDDVVPPTQEEVERAVSTFIGRIQQTPPKFSAIKLQGRRAYDLARAGAEVEMQSRPVEVYRIEIEEYSFPKLLFEIECGSGTYIRSIARDLGEVLGVGGLMGTLERTAVGVFELKDAVSLERFEQEDWRTHLRPLLDGCAEMPTVVLDDEERRHFDAGRAFPFTIPGVDQPSEAALVSDTTFIGIGAFDPAAGILRPSKGGFAGLP
jgi:tRNA pseudouridine55 synthase